MSSHCHLEEYTSLTACQLQTLHWHWQMTCSMHLNMLVGGGAIIIRDMLSNNICTSCCVFCLKIYAVLTITGSSRARQGEKVDSEATILGLSPHRVTHTEKLQISSMQLFITGSTLVQAVITINKAKNRSEINVSVATFSLKQRSSPTTSDHKQCLRFMTRRKLTESAEI